MLYEGALGWNNIEPQNENETSLAKLENFMHLFIQTHELVDGYDKGAT